MHKSFGLEQDPVAGRQSPGPARNEAAHALAYRADIDGLRAIAILSVVIFHAEFGFLSGGFVGVDVFFVISGFLISTIVLKEAAAGKFSLLNFYKRRTLRIFPALFTVIAACFIAGWFIFPPGEYNSFASSAFATAAFYSNFYFDNNSDYFAAAAITMPLLHTWSLAVEEQFYLLTPGLLLLAVRFPRFAKAGFLLLFAASLAFSVFLLGKDASKAFYILPSRAFELMVGTALAMGLVPAIRNQAVAQASGLAGLMLIALAAFTYSKETAFPGFAALVPCFGAALIIHSGQHIRTATARLLSTAPMVFIGKVSYSFYLWHWPFLVFAFFQYGLEISLTTRIALMIGAFLVSVLSYYLVEQPARIKGTALKGATVLLIGALAILACYGVRTLVKKSDGVFWRLPPAAAAFANENPSSLSIDGLCRDDTRVSDAGEIYACKIGAPGATPQFLLFGDSHAQAVGREIANLASEAGIAGQTLMFPGCPPIQDFSNEDTQTINACASKFAMLDVFLADPSIKTIVIANRWAVRLTGHLMPNEMKGWRHPPGTFGKRDPGAFEAPMTDTLRKIREHGKHVVFLGPVPELGFHPREEMIKTLIRGQSAEFTFSRQSFDERQKEVMPFLARLDAMDGVDVFYPHEILCSAEHCQTMLDEGRTLYIDNNHLNATGAALLAPMLKKAITAQ